MRADRHTIKSRIISVHTIHTGSRATENTDAHAISLQRTEKCVPLQGVHRSAAADCRAQPVD